MWPYKPTQRKGDPEGGGEANEHRLGAFRHRDAVDQVENGRGDHSGQSVQ